MPDVTFENYQTASNRDLYDFITQKKYIAPTGFIETDPTEAELHIASKIAACEEYCMNTELMNQEYARFEACDFNEYDYAMMFCNIDVLKILHEHTMRGETPNTPGIIKAYKEELAERYRDRLIGATLDVLKRDVPQDEKVTQDIIVLREVIRQLDQHLAHYVELYAALEDSDRELTLALSLAAKRFEHEEETKSVEDDEWVEISYEKKEIKQTIVSENSLFSEMRTRNARIYKPHPAKFKKPHEKHPTVERDALIAILNKKYAAVVIAHDQKLMGLLYEQFKQQQALLDRLGVPKKAPPVPPRDLVNGETFKKHMARVNRMLHSHDKITVNDHQITRQIADLVKKRQKVMSEHIKDVRKHAKLPMRVTHLFSDMKHMGAEVRADMDQALLQTLEQVEEAAKATQAMIDTAGDLSAAKIHESKQACQQVIDDVKAVKADIEDIKSEFSINPLTAVMKVIALVKNIYHVYRDVCDSVADKTSRVTQKFGEAKDRVASILEPLVTGVHALLEKGSALLPTGMQKFSFEFQDNELASTKRRKEREQRRT